MPRIKQHLSQTYPRVDVRFVSAYTSEQSRGLVSGTLQAGLVIPPIQDSKLMCEGLHRDTLVLALPTHHPLTHKPELETTDLHEIPLVAMRSDFEPGLGECLNSILRVAR